MALEKDALIGFACYDCTRKNFFGPTGVAENARGRGAGLALLLSCLHAMRDNGYYIANIFAQINPEDFLKDPQHLEILQQMILEQFLIAVSRVMPIRRA